MYIWDIKKARGSCCFLIALWSWFAPLIVWLPISGFLTTASRAALISAVFFCHPEKSICPGCDFVVFIPPRCCTLTPNGIFMLPWGSVLFLLQYVLLHGAHAHEPCQRTAVLLPRRAFHSQAVWLPRLGQGGGAGEEAAWSWWSHSAVPLSISHPLTELTPACGSSSSFAHCSLLSESCSLQPHWLSFLPLPAWRVMLMCLPEETHRASQVKLEIVFILPCFSLKERPVLVFHKVVGSDPPRCKFYF